MSSLRHWSSWLHDFFLLYEYKSPEIDLFRWYHVLWSWEEMSTRFEENSNLKVLLRVSKSPSDWNILENYVCFFNIGYHF